MHLDMNKDLLRINNYMQVLLITPKPPVSILKPCHFDFLFSFSHTYIHLILKAYIPLQHETLVFGVRVWQDPQHKKFAKDEPNANEASLRTQRKNEHVGRNNRKA